MADERLTIDELAQRTEMTVRNIRAHQSRGLLPPPELQGRTGYYGPEHVARIDLIKELQADGLNLELIRRLLESGGGSSREVLRFTRALREPFGDEAPEVIAAADLAEAWSTSDASLLERAEALGLLRTLDDGRIELRSPRLARAGAELARQGIPAASALDVLAAIRRSAEDVADTFAALFVREVWEPFDRAGRPAERWPEVANAIERLHPLATESMLSVFQLVMDETVEREFERVRDQVPEAEAS